MSDQPISAGALGTPGAGSGLCAPDPRADHEPQMIVAAEILSFPGAEAPEFPHDPYYSS